MKLTRRQLLMRGGFATGGLMVAGAAIRAGELFDQSAAPNRKTFSDRELAILGPLIEAMFPDGSEMPAGDREFMTSWSDEFLARTDPAMRLIFKSMLHVIEEHSRLTRLRPFSTRTLEARMEELRAWELTPIYLKRAAFSSTKLILGMAYFEQPGVNQALGWYVGCAPEHLLHKSKNGQATS